MAKDKPNLKNLPDEIPLEVATVIKGLPLDKQKVIIQALSITHHRSGPLPPGDEIRIYAEVIPDGGNRLMSTVETQLT